MEVHVCCMFCTQVQLILVCYRWPWTLGQTLSVLPRASRTSDRWVKIFIEVKKFNIQRNHSFNLLFQLKNTQVCFCLLKLLFVYPNTKRNLNCNQQNLLLPFLEKKNMFHCKQRFIKQVIVHTNCMNSVFYFHSNVQIEFFFIKVQTKVSKHTSKYNVSMNLYFQMSDAASQTMVEYALADIIYHVENEGKLPEF